MEDAIRRFYRVDKLLPPVLPMPVKSELAKYVVITDNNRSPEDVLEDIDGRITPEDFDVWDNVGRLLCEVPWTINKQIVCLRCQGKGWRRVAKELKRAGIVPFVPHRVTLWRHFAAGLDEILMNSRKL